MGNALDKKGNIDPKYLLPQAPYSKTVWDPKVLKKSVTERKLAPFFPGAEEKFGTELEECPICFLYFPGGLNRAKCCKKGVCSECYVQIKKGQNAATCCPFCNNRRYMTVYTGPLSKEERDTEDREEKKVVELKAKILLEETQRRNSAPTSPSPQLSSSTSSVASSPASPLTASSPYSSERKDSAPPPPPLVRAPVYEEPFVPPAGVNADEAMLAEAIRRSLLDSSGAPDPSSVSEAPQSAASDRDVAAAPQAAVVLPPRRIALEDPSEAEAKSDESDSSSSSSSRSVSDNDEDAVLARKFKNRVRPSVPNAPIEDAELREAIRLSLMEGAEAPAAVRP